MTGVPYEVVRAAGERRNRPVGRKPGVPSGRCPRCGHADEDHERESWYDEEGVEGMTCSECPNEGDCRWWTWDWAEVLSGEAM